MKKEQIELVKLLTIENSAQHKKTTIPLKKFNVIGAANGTGKTTFANLFINNNEFYENSLLFKADTKIELIGNGNKKGRMTYKDGEMVWNKRLKLQPNVLVYNDAYFLNLYMKHNKGDSLLNLDLSQAEINELSNMRSYIEKISKYESQFSEGEIPEEAMNTLPKFKSFLVRHKRRSRNSRFARENGNAFNEFLKQILDIYKNNFTAKEIQKLDMLQTKFLSITLNLKLEDIKEPVAHILNYKFTNTISHKYRLKEARKQKINYDKNELEYLLIWFAYLVHRKQREVHESFLTSLDTFKINKFENLDTAIKRKIKEKQNKKKKNEAGTNKLRGELVKFIKLTKMRDKVLVEEDLSITNKNHQKIILSTGEIRILTFITFLFNNLNKNKFIIFDDPFTSVDYEYISNAIKYMHNKVSMSNNNQIIFLTHNTITYTTLRNIFKKDTNYIKWNLKNQVVESSLEDSRNNNLISRSLAILNDEQENSLIRLGAIRRMLEFISYSLSGNTDYQRFMTKNGISILNFSYPLLSESVTFLNSGAHFYPQMYENELEFIGATTLIINDFKKMFNEMGIINNNSKNKDGLKMTI